MTCHAQRVENIKLVINSVSRSIHLPCISISGPSSNVIKTQAKEPNDLQQSNVDSSNKRNGNMDFKNPLL